MKIIDVEQGTPEWFAARLGKFTGSDISDLMYAAKPTKAYTDLINEKRSESKHGITQYEIEKRVGRCIYENFEPSIGVNGKYGKLMESDALEYYAKKYDEEIHTVGFVVSDKWPEHVGTSPDSLHTRKSSGVEIKCHVTLAIHDAATNLKNANDLKEFNVKYYWQVLHNMLVCEAESWDFVSYLPFISPEYVMSCLAITKMEVLNDLGLLEERINTAIKLKTNQ